MKKSEAIAYRRSIEDAAAYQPDEKALGNIYLYPEWREGLAVKAGDRYRYGDKLYKCVQDHTTQADWTPDKTPALWTVISLDEWPEWVQPTGAHDAYQVGDKVTHLGQRYTSRVRDNVWEPTPQSYQWRLES